MQRVSISRLGLFSNGKPYIRALISSISAVPTGSRSIHSSYAPLLAEGYRSSSRSGEGSSYGQRSGEGSSYGQRSGQDRFRSGGSRGGFGGFSNRGGSRNGGRGGRRTGGGGGGGEFDSARNRNSVKGPEGDGLNGIKDYERIKDFEELDLNKLEIGDLVSETPNFSSIKVSSLIDKKVISPVLANSLIVRRKYDVLTTVQAHTLLPILRGESVIVRAKTGTGKTAAFAIPSLQLVLESKKQGIDGVKAVIVSPTRELAQQIADEISSITSYGELRQVRTVCMVGGLSKGAQIRQAFENHPYGADIIVATPGRLLDVLGESHLLEHFKNVKIKVLDEADRLLDIGFKETLEDIDDILKSQCESFQTMLFSATIDRAVKSFAKQELGTAARFVDTVPANEPESHELVDQHVVLCEGWAQMYAAAYATFKSELDLYHEKGNSFKAIAFLPTVPSSDHFASILSHSLQDEGTPEKVYVLHGKMTQGARQRVADKFRRSSGAILVTTDVTARGMDFPDVSHVLQLGSPRDVASYIHRIGRTARQGKTGKSYLIMTKHEQGYLKDLKSRNINFQNIDKYVENEGDVAKIATAVAQANIDDETKANVLQGVFSCYAYLRNEYRVNPREYFQNNIGFSSVLGIEGKPRVPQGSYSQWGLGARDASEFFDVGRHFNDERTRSDGGSVGGRYNDRNFGRGGRSSGGRGSYGSRDGKSFGRNSRGGSSDEAESFW